MCLKFRHWSTFFNVWIATFLTSQIYVTRVEMSLKLRQRSLEQLKIYFYKISNNFPPLFLDFFAFLIVFAVFLRRSLDLGRRSQSQLFSQNKTQDVISEGKKFEKGGKTKNAENVTKRSEKANLTSWLCLKVKAKLNNWKLGLVLGHPVKFAKAAI